MAAEWLMCLLSSWGSQLKDRPLQVYEHLGSARSCLIVYVITWWPCSHLQFWSYGVLLFLCSQFSIAKVAYEVVCGEVFSSLSLGRIWLCFLSDDLDAYPIFHSS